VVIRQGGSVKRDLGHDFADLAVSVAGAVESFHVLIGHYAAVLGALPGELQHSLLLRVPRRGAPSWVAWIL
jgi:hypothetical protein